MRPGFLTESLGLTPFPLSRLLIGVRRGQIVRLLIPFLTFLSMRGFQVLIDPDDDISAVDAESVPISADEAWPED